MVARGRARKNSCEACVAHVAVVAVLDVLAELERGNGPVVVLVGTALDERVREEVREVAAGLELVCHKGDHVFLGRKQAHSARLRDQILCKSATEAGIQHDELIVGPKLPEQLVQFVIQDFPIHEFNGFVLAVGVGGLGA